MIGFAQCDQMTTLFVQQYGHVKLFNFAKYSKKIQIWHAAEPPPPTKRTKEFEKYPSGEFFPVLVTLLVAYTRVLVPTSVNQNNSNLLNIVTKIHD